MEVSLGVGRLKVEAQAGHQVAGIGIGVAEVENDRIVEINGGGCCREDEDNEQFNFMFEEMLNLSENF